MDNNDKCPHLYLYIFLRNYVQKRRVPLINYRQIRVPFAFIFTRQKVCINEKGLV
jgi:hypothetical protein